MRLIRKIIFAITLVSLAQPALAAEADNAVRQLYIKTGMATQLQQLAPTIKSGMEQAMQQKGAKMDAAMMKNMAAAATTAYEARKLETIVLGYMSKNLNAADIKGTVTWLDSDLGKKISQLEKQAGTPAAQQMKAYFQTFQKNPPAGKRIDMIGNLVLATKAIETGTEIALKTQVAVMTAMLSNTPQVNKEMIKLMQAQIEQQRPKIVEAIAEQIIMAFLFTYRGLSDQEISKYIQFANSAVGKKYHEVMSGALILALTQAGDDLGKAITPSAMDKKKAG